MLSSLPREVNAETMLRFSVETRDRNGKLCATGGASFRLWLAGDALLPGFVKDSGNGTYEASVFTGWLPGQAEVFLVLDFVRCEGASACSVGSYVLGNTTRVLLQRVAPAMPRIKIVRPAARRDVANSSLRILDGRWQRKSKAAALPRWKPGSHPNLSSHLRWVPSDREALALYHASSRKDVVRAIFTRRWIHMVGKSMTHRFREALVAHIQHSGFKDVVKQEESREGMELLTGCKQVNNAGMYFVHGLRLLVTAQPDSNGFDARTSVYDVNASLRCVLDMVKHTRWAHASRGRAALLKELMHYGPDVVVYNHGIHSASTLNAEASIEAVRTYQRAHFHALGRALSSRGTVLVWRNTAPTHFWANDLPQAWMCRTLSRIACINEATRDALSDLAVEEGGSWRELDFWTLGQLRHDCTPDNRHYTSGNCGDALSRLFAVSLPGWLQAVATERSVYRGRVAGILNGLDR